MGSWGYVAPTEVPDVDAEHARLAALGLSPPALRPPRDTGDGFREARSRCRDHPALLEA